MKRLPVKNLLNFHPELKGSEVGVLERKGLTTDFSTNDLNEFESIGILSTPSIDAEGDILDPDGMDTSIFNGVVIFNHDLGELPIGSITEIKKSKEGVTGKFKFSEKYAFAQDCFNLIKEKILRGISVGYLPTKVYKRGTTAFNELAKAKGWATAGVERIIAGWQLIEVSVCNVGCNADALLLASKSFKSDLTFKNFKIETKGCKVDENIENVEKAITEDLPAVSDVSTETTEVLPEVLPELPVEKVKEVQDILIVEEPVNEQEIPSEIPEVDQTMPEASGTKDTTTLPEALTVDQVEPEVVTPITDTAEEVVEPEVIKPMVLKVIRMGKRLHNQEIKDKALRFLQGKSF